MTPGPLLAGNLCGMKKAIGRRTDRRETDPLKSISDHIILFSGTPIEWWKRSKTGNENQFH